MDTEIDETRDDYPNVEKYDVSEKNENSFLYKIYKGKDTFILEDKKVKNKNKVKLTLSRFIFSNKEDRYRNFNAEVKKQKSIKVQTLKNCFIASDNKIRDKVDSKQMKCFLNLQRFRENMTFPTKEDIVISIGFSGED